MHTFMGAQEKVLVRYMSDDVINDSARRDISASTNSVLEISYEESVRNMRENLNATWNKYS